MLELGSRIGEAIPYCEKAITLCKSRLVRLKEDENMTSATGASESSMPDSEENDRVPANETKSASNLTKDIEFFTEILSELEKKVWFLTSFSFPYNLYFLNVYLSTCYLLRDLH